MLAPRGKAKAVILTSFIVLAFVGGLLLCTGLIALTGGQPRHVWYPLVLIGGIVVLVVPMQIPMLRTRYRQAELRRLEAEELRRA